MQNGRRKSGSKFEFVRKPFYNLEKHVVDGCFYFHSKPTSIMSLEDHLKNHMKQLEELETATSLIRSRKDPEIANGLQVVKEELSGLNDNLKSARADLEKMKQQNEAMKSISNVLDKLKKRISHMEANVPTKLLQDYASVQPDEKPNCTGTSTSDRLAIGTVMQDGDDAGLIEDCKKTLFDEPRNTLPKIRPLDIEEFKLVPKYMIGRQSLEAVNQFLTIINQILEAKYSILALGKNGARKKGLLDLYLSYQKQESLDSKEQGKVYFFTEEDYNKHTKTKLDKTKLNLLIVLRHCKRLREVRASKAIQYTLISP